MTSATPSSLFPPQTSSYILSFQFSSWYPQFSHLSIKSTIIRPLPKQFCDYLDADGVQVPEGSEDVPVVTSLTDDDNDDVEHQDDHCPSFAFPELDAKIRSCVKEYGAVFPKLNFSSPKDASWILPPSSPLKCTSPADVYLLLKSSDFITHDLSTDTVFEGCQISHSSTYELELILRKWYPIDRSRELRCFVRQGVLMGISQRDNNYYEFLNDPATHKSIASVVQEYWEKHIKTSPYWEPIQDYTFDLLLTRDLLRGHILDFNPYAPRTDPLLFTYEELAGIFAGRSYVNTNQQDQASPRLPEFRVIDSRAHPAATSSAPAYQHNMMPFEALNLSSGRDIEDFAELWKEEIRQNMAN